jgi:hypothetical protein
MIADVAGFRVGDYAVDRVQLPGGLVGCAQAGRLVRPLGGGGCAAGRT